MSCLICCHAKEEHFCEDEGGGYHGDDFCGECSRNESPDHRHQYIDPQERVATLEAALRPFAHYADTMSAHDDNQRIGHFLVSHFRAAAKALRDSNNDF